MKMYEVRSNSFPPRVRFFFHERIHLEMIVELFIAFL